MGQSIMFFLKYMLTPLMMIMMLSLLFSKNITILSMLIYLLIFSMLTVLNLSKLFNSNLFSYFTFLMMTGGILILFAFFLSLTSNQLSSPMSISPPQIILYITLSIYIMSILTTPLKMINFTYNNEFAPLTSQSLDNYYFNLNKLYMYPHNMMICMLIFFLLISLIFITKISFSKNKPMRKMSD